MLLAERLGSLNVVFLVSFLSYRSNKAFSELMLTRRPEILDGLRSFYTPIKEDMDASLAAALHKQGLLPDEIRSTLVEALRTAAVDDADPSFLEDSSLEAVLTESEKADILAAIKSTLLPHIADHVDRLRSEWDANSDPEQYFEQFGESINRFVEAIDLGDERDDILRVVRSEVSTAVSMMNQDYEPSPSTSAPTSSSPTRTTPLTNLFRDVDE